MKKQSQNNRSKRMAITVSEAIGAFERAFRTGNPNEVELLLREMLNVQVAVVDSKQEAEESLANGKMFKTVTVPYGVFLGKIREILKERGHDYEDSGVYSLEPNPILDDDSRYVLYSLFSSETVLPGKTYVLLSTLAGYSSIRGLTFAGSGEPTGFEMQTEAEHREKFGEGRFQTWQDHIAGVWQRSKRLAETYRPFVARWASKVLAPQWEESDSKISLDEFVSCVLWAMRVAVMLHDIGKLRKSWQQVVWENEKNLSKKSPGSLLEEKFIARTSPAPEEKRPQLRRPEPHAPYAYPFLSGFLKAILGNWRFLESVIALAAARHHSLEVTGSLDAGRFNLAEGADEFIKSWLPMVLGVEGKDRDKFLKALDEAIECTKRGSPADEPPSPSDDFYFLYCLTNRMVKVCDWEDASEHTIEVPDFKEGDCLLPARIELAQQPYRVYKTGIAFYDAARLIGVAHLLFGTASAEVEDRGFCWEVKGISVKRDAEQIKWVLEEGKRKSHDLNQKSKQLDNVMNLEQSPHDFKGLPVDKGDPALKEFDAGLQYSPRGVDPLSDAVVISSQGTKPKRTEKQFLLPSHELAAASVGFSFAAYARSGKQITYILPVFTDRFVLSGFLTYARGFRHPASGFVAEVLAALSIILDLVARRLPVKDFTFTRIFGQNIYSSSGFLGFERLCDLCWIAVQANDDNVLNLLRDFRTFLSQTASPQTNEQVQSLARWVADFVANPNVDTLTMIECLKARVLAASQSKNFPGAYAANNLLNRAELVKGVRKMLQIDLPEVPRQLSEALTRALSFEEKGWMNKLTRLENAPNFSRFVQQVEHIVSRGYYREQQEKGAQLSIQQALTQARDVANTLRRMAMQVQDEKSFRAWRAIFLLDVLSRASVRAKAESSEISAGTSGVKENLTSKEG